MAKVREIQICGGEITDSLFNACLIYIDNVEEGIDREKLHFTIILDDNTLKSITFRQEDDGIHVYGDFEGMPDALEWAQRILKDIGR